MDRSRIRLSDVERTLSVEQDLKQMRWPDSVKINLFINLSIYCDAHLFLSDWYEEYKPDYCFFSNEIEVYQSEELNFI